MMGPFVSLIMTMQNNVLFVTECCSYAVAFSKQQIKETINDLLGIL